MLLDGLTIEAPSGEVLPVGDWTVGPDGHAEGLLLETLEISGPSRDVPTTRAPYRRGVSATPARVGARQMVVEMRAVGPDRATVNALRRRAMRVLGDHGGRPLTVRLSPDADDELELAAHVDGPVAVERAGRGLLIEAVLTAPDPVAYLPTDETGSVDAGATATWDVGGEVAVYPRWVITGPSSGTAQTITLTVDGETLTLDGVDLAAGSTLVLEGAPGRERVTVDGVSVIGTIDRDGTPWLGLEPGAASVTLAVTSGDAAGVAATATWRPGVMP